MLWSPQTGAEVTTLTEVQAGTPQEGGLPHHFDRNRQPYIHYQIFAHARGRALSAFPCLQGTGEQTQETGSRIRTTPGSVPPSIEATRGFMCRRARQASQNFPGGSHMVSLGLWDTDKFVASKLLQASTFFHQLGHGLNLWHGGKAAIFGNATTPTQVEPNCKPNYQSSMSYLFQAHGLVNDAGQLDINYCGTLHNPLDETSLSNGLSPTPNDTRRGLHHLTVPWPRAGLRQSGSATARPSIRMHHPHRWLACWRAARAGPPPLGRG